jgi:hypothetical protein
MFHTLPRDGRVQAQMNHTLNRVVLGLVPPVPPVPRTSQYLLFTDPRDRYCDPGLTAGKYERLDENVHFYPACTLLAKGDGPGNVILTVE